MGHIRVGSLPDTPRWRDVVGLVAEKADVSRVAGATMRASERGLKLASLDEGLRHAVYLLARLTLAARESDFTRALHSLGISVPPSPTVLEVASGFTDAMDRHLHARGGRTDISEMAQHAAVETISALAGEWATKLIPLCGAGRGGGTPLRSPTVPLL